MSRRLLLQGRPRRNKTRRIDVALLSPWRFRNSCWPLVSSTVIPSGARNPYPGGRVFQGRDASTPPEFRFATLRLRSARHWSGATEDGTHYFLDSYRDSVFPRELAWWLLAEAEGRRRLYLCRRCW